MIHFLHCDKNNFKTIEFRKGFNVVLADRTKEATKKDSRNGLGKTTLLEIIHFCLGSSIVKGKGLFGDKLADWTFTLDVDLRGQKCSLNRKGADGNRHVGVEGGWLDWPLTPRMDPKTKEPFFAASDLTELLGWLMFDLAVNTSDGKYTPTFRSLISYFIRKGRDAFSTPFEHHRKQQEWDRQVNNAFLLGLSWEYAQKGQIFKDQEKTLAQLKQAARAGFLPDLLGSIGELETQKVRLEETLSREKERLDSFKVHPEYRTINEKANTLTREIHELANENVSDQRLVEYYESSFQQEEPASEDDVIRIYEEAKVLLPELLTKHLGEVREFHQRVIANRKSFLEAEIAKLTKQISEREGRIRTATDDRAGLLTILKNHGALEEYTRLQERHAQAVAELEEIKKRIDNLNKFEKGRSTLRIEQEKLQIEARSDYEERRELRDRAISLFNANSEALYEAPGKLIINVGSTGYKFDVDIERSKSQGIEQMKVFCYDLMLAQLWSTRPTSPGFLIHDSTIFDGVDERQVAHALQIAAESSERFGFQYICCLNSDAVPWKEFTGDFNLRKFVCCELTDAQEDGGLLGIRF